MSWSELHPVFTEELNQEYIGGRKVEEGEILDRFFCVEDVVNRSDRDHVLATAFFGDSPRSVCEPALMAQNGGIIVPNLWKWRQFLSNLRKKLDLRLPGAKEVVVRVYLADYLGELVPDLVALGWEVVMMKAGSGRFSIARMWPFLALESGGTLVTVTTPDKLWKAGPNLERTRLMESSGLGMWRVPASSEDASSPGRHYYPISRHSFGAKGGSVAMADLLKAVTWCSMQELLPRTVVWPGCGEQYMSSADWRDTDFDLWFLAVAFYPRMAAEGVLTFAEGCYQCPLFSLDVEYVTWANPESQLLFYGAKKCC